jgi:uncharacterized protein YukE
MERIRVNTEELKDKSKVFESSAGVFSQAGKEILSFAAGLPSYDGQLSGPARAAALEINRQCQDVHSCLMNDAQSLAKTAQAFEDADNQTITTFMDNLEAIGDAPLITQGGKGKGLAIIKPPEDWGDKGPIVQVESDGSTTEITSEDETLPDGTIITKYKQKNTKTYSEADIRGMQIWGAVLDAIFGLLLAFLFPSSAIKMFLEKAGIFDLLLSVFKIMVKDYKHDLPELEPGDTRVITLEGTIITNTDGTTSSVWTSTIEIYGADGTLKGKITNTYKKP